MCRLLRLSLVIQNKVIFSFYTFYIFLLASDTPPYPRATVRGAGFEPGNMATSPPALCYPPPPLKPFAHLTAAITVPNLHPDLFSTAAPIPLCQLLKRGSILYDSHFNLLQDGEPGGEPGGEVRGGGGGGPALCLHRLCQLFARGQARPPPTCHHT